MEEDLISWSRKSEKVHAGDSRKSLLGDGMTWIYE
jgi:hypothetical protein